jgi:hypothetical protein
VDGALAIFPASWCLPQSRIVLPTFSLSFSFFHSRGIHIYYPGMNRDLPPRILSTSFSLLSCFCLGHNLPLSSDIFTSAPHATAYQTSPITSSNPISDLPIPAYISLRICLAPPHLILTSSYLTCHCLYPLTSSPHSPGRHVLQLGLPRVLSSFRFRLPMTLLEALRPLRHRRTSFAIISIDNHISSRFRLKRQLSSSVHSSPSIRPTSLPLSVT